jgi:hypothetical protein
MNKDSVIMDRKASTPQPVVGQNKVDNREKPRLAQGANIDAEKLLEWFDYALEADDPKPTRAACEKLATEIRLVLERQNKIGNRRNNADLERKHKGAIPLSQLKDISPLEEQENRFRKFQEASARLLLAIDETRSAARDIEDNDGSFLWIDKGGAVSLDDLEELLLRACAVPAAPRPTAHRRRQVWHGAAPPIADLIRSVLRDDGYERNLNSAGENGPVVVIGAKVISATYNVKIRPSGFVTALRNRNRAKKSAGDFDLRFPGVARIKIL